MATINKITEMIASIKTIYPYYAKDTDVQMLVKTWNVLLKNYPDEAVEVAFFKCLQTCKMPPTPADVIEALNAMIESTEPTEEELWDSFTKALKQTEKEAYCFGFTFRGADGKTQGDVARENVQKIWDNLPEKVQRYIGSKNELIRIARNHTADELKFEKNRFLKAMPTIKTRQEFTSLASLLGDNKLMLKGEGN